jgi:hypothetical protein
LVLLEKLGMTVFPLRISDYASIWRHVLVGCISI